VPEVEFDDRLHPFFVPYDLLPQSVFELARGGDWVYSRPAPGFDSMVFLLALHFLSLVGRPYRPVMRISISGPLLSVSSGLSLYTSHYTRGFRGKKKGLPWSSNPL
jgi:hypothetical protein